MRPCSAPHVRVVRRLPLGRNAPHIASHRCDVRGQGDAAPDRAEGCISGTVGVVEDLVDFVDDVGEVVGDVVDTVSSVASHVAQGASQVASAAYDIAASVVDTVTSFGSYVGGLLWRRHLLNALPDHPTFGRRALLELPDGMSRDEFGPPFARNSPLRPPRDGRARKTRARTRATAGVSPLIPPPIGPHPEYILVSLLQLVPLTPRGPTARSRVVAAPAVFEGTSCGAERSLPRGGDSCDSPAPRPESYPPRRLLQLPAAELPAGSSVVRLQEKLRTMTTMVKDTSAILSNATHQAIDSGEASPRPNQTQRSPKPIRSSRTTEATSGIPAMVCYFARAIKGLWGVECILAVIGTGGP
eukprot:1187364-Prorocentrum_minimum.AAC.1